MERSAEKPLALLISGLDGTGKLYLRQIEPLSNRYRTLAWSFSPRAAFDLDDLVEEIACGTEGEQIPMVVVGESFGGMIAMKFALDYPDRVGRLALVNAFPWYARKWRIRLACVLSGLLSRRSLCRVKDWAAERTLATEGVPPENRRAYIEAIRAVHYPAYRRRLELVRDVDLRPRLSAIKAPTILFASGRDKIVPSIRAARLMASMLRDATVHEFPQAGHALLLTPGFTLADYLCS